MWHPLKGVVGIMAGLLMVATAPMSRLWAQPPWQPPAQPPYSQPQNPYAQPQPPYVQPPVTTTTQDPNRMVSHWYRHYLHRRPDPDGLRNCIYQLQTGVTPTAVQAGLLGSGEYFQNHGNDPTAFVQGLYADVLGRQPSPRAMGYWLRQLDRDGGNRQQMALDFLNSAANRR